MKLVIKKNNFFLVILTFILLLVENVILRGFSTQNYTVWTYILSIIILFNIVVTLFFFNILDIEMISLAGLFVSFSYLFHFGQVIINGLFKNYSYTILNAVGEYSKNTVEALIFSLNIILIITITIMIIGNDSAKKNRAFIMLPEPNLKIIKKIGWSIVFMTIPFQVYVFIKEYVQSRLKAYGTHESMNGVLFEIGILALIGYVMLLFGYSEDKRKVSLVFFIEAVLYMVTMLSGSRIYSVISICTLTYCYLNIRNLMEVKKLLPYFVMGVLFIIVLNSIMHVRSLGPVTVGNIVRYFLIQRITSFLVH